VFNEFKEFALKGNVVDLAIGIVIGAAFGAIVNSVVQDVIMPVVGVITGGLDFSQRFVLLKDGTPPGPYATLAAAKEAAAVTLNLGLFINAVVNFLIVAIALFVVVKGINSARRTKAAEPAAPPAPTNEEKLLMEIRDLLRGSTARA
jgi:large conductance mechanosensitive channel